VSPRALLDSGGFAGRVTPEAAPSRTVYAVVDARGHVVSRHEWRQEAERVARVRDDGCYVMPVPR